MLQHTTYTRILLWGTLRAIVFINVACAAFQAYLSIARLTQVDSSASSFTYRHLDYPVKFPTSPYGEVAMTLHETVRFGINVADPLAGEEWSRGLLMPDMGYGRVRLGPEHHVYVLTHFHQMHCIHIFQQALAGALEMGDSHTKGEHIEHCFKYMRQMFLCQAEVTLEPGDFLQRDLDADRVGGTLACDDWESIYGDIKKNHEDWQDWSKRWN